MTGAFIEARSIRKSYSGVEGLHGVDLDATAGSVLALLGENGAGKSTLVKVIAGDSSPDAGELRVDGVGHAALDPLTARRLGIRMIFQELTDAGTLTVAENICLGRWPRRRGIVDWREVRRGAESILAELGVALDTDALVGSLRVGERQVVEIARALSDRARCLILDEPTAALSSQEAERLFSAVRRLRERGVAIVYITHRLDEVSRIADKVQVLRDGTVVLQGAVPDFSRRELVSAMVGRALQDVQRPANGHSAPATTPIIRFENGTSGAAFHDVTLDVFPGDVVALYGKLGAGTAEVVEVAFGLRTLTAGVFELEGTRTALKGPYHAIRQGIGLLPADRQREGAFMVLGVAENLAAPSWGRLARFGVFILRRAEALAYGRWRQELSIRSRGPRQEFRTLSGGNQQKVLLGRWLERRSSVLLLIEPTRGVDVGARQEIYRSIRALAASGVAVLVSTSDYEEVVQLADKAVVMSQGRVVAHLNSSEITTERLATAVGA